ncbi:restriction endonuclease subunit S [Kitasatospora sp. NPDC088346]|uniref:restriction endonuclease subunit S n=1 Tax=Kitasatospora sp. NPDC088346 TaxID=3364073 RepID=UPI003806A104
MTSAADAAVMGAADHAGDLPSGWAWAKLSELGTWYGGGTPSKRRPEFWQDGSIPWLSPKDMGDSTLAGTQDLIHTSALDDSPVKLVPAHSVALVVRSGILERKLPIAYVPFATTLNQDMKAVSPHKGIDPRWLTWALRAHEQYLLKNCRKRGTTVASLEVPWLMDVLLPVPPAAEQHRIAAKLEEHITRITAGEAAVASARAQIKALQTNLVDNGIAALDEYPIERLGDLLREPLRNGVSAKATADGSGIRTLTLTAITQGRFIDDFTKMTCANPARATDLWLEDGDIFIERSNAPDLVGTSALYSGPSGWAIFPDLLIRVRVDCNRASPDFVALVLKTEAVMSYFKRKARGLSGSMPKIDQTTISGTRIPLPSLEKQQEIVANVEKQHAILDQLMPLVARTKDNAAELRAALFSAAAAGTLVPQDPTDEPASVLLERIRFNGGESATVRKRTLRVPGPRKKAAPNQGEIPQ